MLTQLEKLVLATQKLDRLEAEKAKLLTLARKGLDLAEALLNMDYVDESVGQEIADKARELREMGGKL